MATNTPKMNVPKTSFQTKKVTVTSGGGGMQSGGFDKYYSPQSGDKLADNVESAGRREDLWNESLLNRNLDREFGRQSQAFNMQSQFQKSMAGKGYQHERQLQGDRLSNDRVLSGQQGQLQRDLSYSGNKAAERSQSSAQNHQMQMMMHSNAAGAGQDNRARNDQLQRESYDRQVARNRDFTDRQERQQERAQAMSIANQRVNAEAKASATDDTAKKFGMLTNLVGGTLSGASDYWR